ncbi:MAG: VWA domain-containing protein [Chloroherpetonaceae bacterium]|nr:VWA domain-containing protein [Chthonomonadaceae bacterium]MDW8207685.1 VWA domain-containing protein [Chloroherpetonaceae bacterium]
MVVPAAVKLSLWEWLLGLPPGLWKRVEQMQPVFVARETLGALLIVLALAVFWFAFQYWRDGTRPSWWSKGPMLLLRLLALTALGVMLLQPSLRLQQTDTVRPAVVLLVDTSDSMARTDPRLPAVRAQREARATGMSPATVGQATRLTRANALLNRAQVLQELSKRYAVRVYGFASDAQTVPLPDTAESRTSYRFSLQREPGKSDSTQIGTALRRALEDLSGQPVAGALILSDGGNNLGEDPLAVAEMAKQAGIPVSTLGLGDPTKTKDLSLLSVLADDVVRVNNTVNVFAALSHRGYAGKTVTVILQRGTEVLGRETVRLGRDERKQEVRFTYVPREAGRFTYTVTVSPLPDEVTRANNKRSFVQTAVSKKLRVLYVEEEPRYEYRYLKNAILRDTSLEFACLLLSADDPDEGNLRVREFPRDEKALFDFDIVILGDVPRSAFTDSQLEALRRFVEDRGASLLVIAGERHMPHEYAGTPLEAVLPVVFGPSPDPILTEEPFRWQLTPEGQRSVILQLEDDPEQNRRVWATLQGMFWAAGVQRARPGATVLAVHPTRRNAEGPYPLVATQPFGAGRSFIQLVDSTWLWRWRVGDRHFYRYWGQVLRTLTPREIPGNSRYVQLNADRTNYRLGERVTLSARLLNAFYRPIKAEKATAILRHENGATQTVTLQGTPGTPGLFTAEVQPDRVGRYEVTVISPANPSARATAAFVVESLALESQKPELDEAMLQRIAAAGGGNYYTPDRIADWMRALSNRPLQIRSEQEIELWDTPLLLILFIVPLSLEWVLRKRKGLL